MFHERVAELRKQHFLTQKELADALKLNRTTYAHYEKDRQPEYETLIKIADYFNVTTDYLLGRDEFIKMLYSTNSTEQLAIIESSRSLNEADAKFLNELLEFFNWRDKRKTV